MTDEIISLARRWAAWTAEWDRRTDDDEILPPAIWTASGWEDVPKLDSTDRETLMDALRVRMAEYRAGAEYEPSLDDFAEWIGMDLGEPFEDNARLTIDLLEVAGQ